LAAHGLYASRMNRHGATSTIWKTVVFAGAMLGAPGCSKKAPPTTPVADTAADPATDAPADDTATEPTEATANPCGDGSADPCADPCGGRPRGVDDEGSTGRGFILS